MRRSMLVTGLDVTRLSADASATTAAAKVGGVRAVLNAKIFMSSAAATPTVGGTTPATGTTTTQPS
jgi:hypothetical protein